MFCLRRRARISIAPDAIAPMAIVDGSGTGATFTVINPPEMSAFVSEAPVPSAMLL